MNLYWITGDSQVAQVLPKTGKETKLFLANNDAMISSVFSGSNTVCLKASPLSVGLSADEEEPQTYSIQITRNIEDGDELLNLSGTSSSGLTVSLDNTDLLIQGTSGEVISISASNDNESTGAADYQLENTEVHFTMADNGKMPHIHVQSVEIGKPVQSLN